MAMKRSEMATQLKLAYGNRSELDTHRTTWLNWAMQDTAAVRNWADMIVRHRDANNEWLKTVEGYQYYELPLNTKDILSVIYRDGSSTCILKYLSEREFDTQYPNPADVGNSTPQEYTRRGDEIELFPWPSEAGKDIEIRAVIWPADFTDAADEECALGRLEHGIIAQAAAYAYRVTRDWDMMKIMHGEWWSIVKRQAQAEGEPADWQPRWGSVPSRTRGLQSYNAIWGDGAEMV